MELEAGKRRTPISSKWQWCVVALIFLIMALPLIIQSKYLQLDGAPVILFWITALMVGGLVFAHSPWVFARLSLPLQVGAYLAILVVPVLVGSTCGKLGDAFEQTAAGASQAAERKVREKAEEEQAAFQQKLEETQDALDEVKRLSDKLEGCFSTFGHRLPELEERVRDSLHNPSSFEHIETLAIVPDGDGNTVAMNFRAENGFGAIRSTHVLAKVIPDTCAIESVTEPQ